MSRHRLPTSASSTAPEHPGDLVPPIIRTVAYAIGTVIATGVVPALIAAGQDVPAGIASGVAGGCLALAFGYNPTRAR